MRILFSVAPKFADFACVAPFILTGCLIGPGALVPPDAPANVTAEAGDSEVLVSWTVPFSGGNKIRGYTVRAVEDTSKKCTTKAMTACVVTGLAGNQPYTFVVTARNRAGTSDPSVPSAPVSPNDVAAFGSTWTVRYTQVYPLSFTWSGSLLVATGSSGMIMTSPDGASWTDRSYGGITTSIRNVASGNGKVIAVVDPVYDCYTYYSYYCLPQDTQILTSLDSGLSWQSSSTDMGYVAGPIIWGGIPPNGQWAAFKEIGTLLTSVDAKSWALRHLGNTFGYGGMIWADSQFIAFSRADYDAPIVTSHDGVMWIQRGTLGSDNGQTVSMAAGDGKIMAVGYSFSGGNKLFVKSSTNSVDWIRQEIETDYFEPRQILWTGSQWVILGLYGSILTSTDGIVWVRRRSNDATSGYVGIVWTGERLVAMGYYGTVLSSP
jgi:hypothetical protein